MSWVHIALTHTVNRQRCAGKSLERAAIDGLHIVHYAILFTMRRFSVPIALYPIFQRLATPWEGRAFTDVLFLACSMRRRPVCWCSLLAQLQYECATSGGDSLRFWQVDQERCWGIRSIIICTFYALYTDASRERRCGWPLRVDRK